MTEARKATVDDCAELIRLRKLMHASMNSPGLNAPEWQRAAAVMLRENLAAPDARLTAFVVDAETGLAACAAGVIQQKLPGPGNPDGLAGYVFNVSTDPSYRRRGYSRACMELLLAWFNHRGVSRIELRTSQEGEPLYASLGFVRTSDPSMVLRS